MTRACQAFSPLPMVPHLYYEFYLSYSIKRRTGAEAPVEIQVGRLVLMIKQTRYFTNEGAILLVALKGNFNVR
ncbi:MAG TPA: hypothetical protein VI382_02930 [Candidatus Manganitrophaceae bacterium]|nr:hypothetical protein [Candidatus Manganitrophaceae bacterium]